MRCRVQDFTMRGDSLSDEGMTRMGVLPKTSQAGSIERRGKAKDALAGAYFWLSAFYFIYCARPEDWIPGLKYLPLAKITACGALIGFLISLNKAKRTFRDLPRESAYLLAMIGLFFIGGFLSPVWKGGAVLHTIDFAKVYVAWVLTFLVISNFEKLRRVIYIQAASVLVICIISLIKGHNRPRLEGVIGGIYSNPNDLAFAIVLSIPFCLAFLITSKRAVSKLLWSSGLLVMLVALFLTASRAGFIDLVISGTVCLWYFGVKGKRFYFILATAFIGPIIMIAAGGKLKDRFEALSGNSATEQSAYGSYEDRMFVMQRAIEGIREYPLFGLGANNFVTYSGTWREVHMTYLQIGAEGGIPALILYLLFFTRGFRNLRLLRRMHDLDPNIKVIIGALHSSLIGFVVGAVFAPEGYQFFPYFAVAYTSTLLAIVNSQERVTSPVQNLRLRSWQSVNHYGTHSRTDALTTK